MVTEPDKRRIAWYKSPISREVLASLNQRTDWQGLLQTVGHLGLLVVTGAAAWYAFGHWPWYIVLLLLYLHGTFYAFLLNAFHELVHQTVFKTKALNTFFLNIISFAGWSNPVMFWASHQEHHKYTLHPPDDLEVVLPQKLTLESFLRTALINPWDLYWRLKLVTRLSLGRVDGAWEESLFPPSAVDQRRGLFRWARLILLGHALVAGVALYFGLWQVLVLFTLAPFYGGLLQYLCNATQHVGLQDEVSDFRLCTRTFIPNPFVRFLYWHMNYHIEHHMYAAVPCYKLGQLRAAILSDLPPAPVGLVATWQEIVPILQRQRVDPKYQYVVQLPTRLAV